MHDRVAWPRVRSVTWYWRLTQLPADTTNQTKQSQCLKFNFINNITTTPPPQCIGKSNHVGRWYWWWYFIKCCRYSIVLYPLWIKFNMECIKFETRQIEIRMKCINPWVETVAIFSADNWILFLFYLTDLRCTI